MNKDVFISYSSNDKASADALCHHLEESGIRCWIAPRDVPVGADWPDSISEAVRTSSMFIVVFSQDTSNSRHVKSEIRQAFDGEKVIVPIRMSSIKPTGGYDHLLGNSHWIDAFPNGIEKHIESIISTIKLVLKREDSIHENNGSKFLQNKRQSPFSKKTLLLGSAIFCSLLALTMLLIEFPPFSRNNAPATELLTPVEAIQNPPPMEFLYGTWECRKLEFGREVKILWTIKSDGTTSYKSYINKQDAYIPSSRWSYSGGLFYEEFDTETTGRSIVRAIDHNTFELTIVDNDAVEYRGEKRLYHRVDSNAEQGAIKKEKED